VQYLLVQVFAELLPVTAGRQLADELVQLINQKRARHGRALLLRHEGLDHVADRHCQRMIREDHFGDQLPGGWDLVDQVREQTTIRRVAVDLFVTPRIDEALESDKLLDPEHRKLGLAVIQGSSPRYGANLLWITVLYGRD